jgi:hypothetical protein
MVFPGLRSHQGLRTPPAAKPVDMICSELSSQRIVIHPRCGLLFQVFLVDLLGPVLETGMPAL